MHHKLFATGYRALLIAVVPALLALVGCEAGGLVEPGSRRSTVETPAEFNRGKFAEYSKVDPVPPRELMGISIVQVLWDNEVVEEHEVDDRGRVLENAALVQDLGFVRHERVVVPLRPWEGRDPGKPRHHHDDAFKYPVEEDGATIIYEAVYRPRWLLTDMLGTPLANIDKDGAIFIYDYKLGIWDYIGHGTAEVAAREVFQLRERTRVVALYDRGNYFDIRDVPDRSVAMRDLLHDAQEAYQVERITDVPSVYVTPLDAVSAQRRYDAAVARAREESAYDPDPIHGDPDRRLNRFGSDPSLPPNYDVEDR